MYTWDVLACLRIRTTCSSTDCPFGGYVRRRALTGFDVGTTQMVDELTCTLSIYVFEWKKYVYGSKQVRRVASFEKSDFS